MRHKCQRVGKPQDKKKAPLKIVPVITEIFTKINIDASGPLPMTPSGNKYIITALCMSSRYPDAIPVANLCSTTVVNALLQIFSRMGFPRELQTDQGTSFMSALTTKFLERFGVKVVRSSVYHPQSNPVERIYRTLKRILHVLCLEAIPDWEKILPQALFALRTVIHDSTGFSPAELVHGKNLRTPVMLLYEKLTEEEHVESSVVDYVFELINRMKRCQELAILHMEDAKQKQKLWYDRRTVERQFQLGELVLVIAPSRLNKLSVQWIGPGEIVQQLSETNYVVKFPEKVKTHVYHVNMLKPYHQRKENINLLCINPLEHDEEEDLPSLELENDSNLFSNIPGCTDLAEHDIELESERAIVAKAYRMSPRQIEILKSEVNKMLELKIIEPGESDFTPPLILVEAQGKEARPCIDYRSRLMANLLRNCEDFAVPYLNDIAIFSLAWDDHLKHLKDVFDRLRSAKLHIKPSKCQFAQAYVKYLGHLVGQGLRTPGELKVQVIKDFPIPTNKTQGRNRKSTVDWNSSCQNAFEELKTRLSKNPVLYSPDFTKPFIIQCDASNLGIGVVLSQVCENEEHPIMFLSKKLSLAEQKYSTTEKECAAIIFAVQKLKCYLDGHQKFVIQTDHNPLVWNSTSTRSSGVIASAGCTEGIRCFSRAEPYQFRQRSTTHGRWERRLVCRKQHTSKANGGRIIGVIHPIPSGCS
ncbi:retrovirus-related Pol polyprotein from transposon 297 [Trichonephila clavipes]|nr:retrovirus-related Pol polyprotein from transposon 297 [Trichonephila clavipes]